MISLEVDEKIDMKSLIIILGFLCTTPSYGQSDSLEIFFIGNIKGEKYKIFWDKGAAMNFKGTTSYKYSFKVPREDKSWSERGWINNVSVYRKGRFSLSYKEVPLTIEYENKKYLVIWRNPALRDQIALQVNWSNTEPKKIR
ncbi:MAG: hypothetical protein EBR30_07840 [Cytophagia bacterium]|nr:hypothetical protein [Cytophagia bacterium]NBW34916.1 hypothetical protein [Cytophagia bacterium]